MIESERLILRHWREADRAPFAAMNADPRVMEHLGPPLDRAASDATMDRMIALQEAGQPLFWAAERRRDGAFLGFVGVKRITIATPFTGHEIGWRLASEHWGAGYAAEGARAALSYGFDVLRLDAILAFTVPHNLRSRAVMRRIGMHRAEGGDFDHPNLAPGDPLRRHVLYRAVRGDR